VPIINVPVMFPEKRVDFILESLGSPAPSRRPSD